MHHPLTNNNQPKDKNIVILQINIKGIRNKIEELKNLVTVPNRTSSEYKKQNSHRKLKHKKYPTTPKLTQRFTPPSQHKPHQQTTQQSQNTIPLTVHHSKQHFTKQTEYPGPTKNKIDEDKRPSPLCLFIVYQNHTQLNVTDLWMASVEVGHLLVDWQGATSQPAGLDAG